MLAQIRHFAMLVENERDFRLRTARSWRGRHRRGRQASQTVRALATVSKRDLRGSLLLGFPTEVFLFSWNLSAADVVEGREQRHLC